MFIQTIRQQTNKKKQSNEVNRGNTETGRDDEIHCIQVKNERHFSQLNEFVYLTNFHFVEYKVLTCCL